MTEMPLLDEDRLAELAGDLGVADLRLVLAMFLDEAAVETARLATGLEETEHMKAGHFLRSGALNLGLMAISDAARTAEVVPAPERPVAVARISMPMSMVRLSAGRESMYEATQALCFLAGANSIFTGDKLLTAPNAGEDSDSALLEKLGLRPLAGEEPMWASKTTKMAECQ